MLSDTVASCLAIALAVCLKKKEKKKRRWMKEWLKKRNEHTHENLLKDLRLSEPSDFQNFLRLDAPSFDDLLKMITTGIEKRKLSLQASVCQIPVLLLPLYE